MVQKTDYPWSGNVAITVNPKSSKNFSVYVRVPNRTTSRLYAPTPEVNGLVSLAVNGSPVKTPTIENGYAVINRKWKSGDKIELVLPMEVQRIKADDRIAADRGLIALRYGPLVYNVEQADHQAVNNALGKSPLTTEWRGDFLGGVKVIKGTWADGSAMLAVPNYARNNRLPAGNRGGGGGEGDSSIDYSGATAATNTPTASTTTTNRPRARGFRGQANSSVWMKDE
jgi:hypothetical protein